MAYSNVFPQPTSRNESVIQYVPYQREVTEYVTQEIVEYVPVQRKITEYYAVQHDVEYQPKLVTNKYVGTNGNHYGRICSRGAMRADGRVLPSRTTHCDQPTTNCLRSTNPKSSNRTLIDRR
jgi:hypothetical protein